MGASLVGGIVSVDEAVTGLEADASTGGVTLTAGGTWVLFREEGA